MSFSKRKYLIKYNNSKQNKSNVNTNTDEVE